MERVKIKFPADNPLYVSVIPVRITDINYGNHMGNDSVLSVAHEARMQLLASWGYTELDAGGNSMIMADVMIAYRGEAYYGDTLQVQLYAGEVGDRSFELLYRITTERNGRIMDIAHIKTGMACFNYESRKIAPMTGDLKRKLLRMDF